ncbi:MAG: DUF218 domain-containing protein [Anaerotignum sp.]|jgi:SanA protein|nr:DUF218 domain-containing protein [Anaerotignum sp.]
MERSRKNFLKKVILSLCCLCILGLGVVYGISDYMERHTVGRILSSGEAQKLDADCILVLGCRVHEDGSPSLMLADRLEKGIELYESGASARLLMSGDHGRSEYDEVNTMKAFAVEQGVPSEAVFMDHAGFSTYDSIYRAKDVFQAEKIIVVSQEYHLSRALYIAERLGLDAYGVAAADISYQGATYRSLREAAARGKDFLLAWVQPQPKFLGEAVPVSGNGDLTNDKEM